MSQQCFEPIVETLSTFEMLLKARLHEKQVELELVLYAPGVSVSYLDVKLSLVLEMPIQIIFIRS